MAKVITKPILLQDSREKCPWDFDGDSDFSAIQVSGLKSGDYSLSGLEDIIIIERKADVNELLSNFFFQKKRLIKEMERLRAVKHVFIVIEQDLSDILNPMSYYVNISRKNRKSPNMPVAVVMSNLLNLMFEYGFNVIFAGSHGREITKSLLLMAYKKYSAVPKC